MALKIKSILNSRVAKNIKWLTFAQLASSLIPFLLIPLLKNDYASENFNAIFFFEAIAAFYFILCDYGINITCTRDIAENKNNRFLIQEIINRGFNTKFILNLICFIAFLSFMFITNTIEDLNIPNVKLIYLFVLIKCIFDSIIPNWYFNGHENFKSFVQINLKSRFGAMILNLLLLKFAVSSIDLYFIINLGASSVILVFTILIMRKDGYLIKFNLLNNYLKQNISYFGIRLMSGLYMSFVPILASTTISVNTGIFFSSIDRVVRLVNKLIVPIADGFYPRLAYLKNHSRSKYLEHKRYAFLILLIGSILFSTALIFFYPIIDSLFLANYNGDDKKISFVILSLLPVILSVGTYLSHLTLNLNRKENIFLIGITAGAICFLISFFPLSVNYGLTGISLSVILSEFSVVLLLFLMTFRKNL